MTTEKQYPKGHFVGIGLAIGIPIGIPIGLILGDIALGVAIGLPIGLGLGVALEKKYNKNPRGLSELEMKRQKTLSWMSIIVGLILFAIILSTYIFIR